MRCGSCNFDNPAGFRFCGQCASPLAAAPGSDPQEGRALRPYTPRYLAEKVLTSRSALEGERKQLTVLFADVKDSLQLAEQVGPEEWHRILDRFFRVLADGVHRFEGTVNQYTGDGMMALFGAPIAHEDHAQRACHAALEIARELGPLADSLQRNLGVEFRVRMGLNSGEVVVGKIGDDLRMDYTAQGHVVGLAARMEELAEPGRIYLTAHVERLVRGFFHLKSLGLRDAPGAGGPLSVYELDAAAADTRLERVDAGPRPPLVGRDGALGTLAKALRQARRGEGLVLGVEGGAGVGKSRLCLEFAAQCRDQGLGVLETHCPAHGHALPHSALRRLLRSFFEVAEVATGDAMREKIRAGSPALADEDVLLLCDLMGCSDPSRPLPPMKPAEREQRLSAAVTRLIEKRAECETLVVLVDDLHWIDAASEAFLAQLVGCVAGSRILLLVNFRPEYRAAWMAQPGFHELGLSSLDRDASLALARRLLGDHPSTAELPELVRERSGGNPLFIEELIHSLFDSGKLEGRPGEYTLVEAADDLEIPETVRAVIAARIDRLSERDKALLRVASVIGKEFTEQVLLRVSDVPAQELEDSLRALHTAELVRPEALYGGRHAFKHPLTCEVAYRSLLSERRKALHVAIAEALVDIGEQLGERAALVAHHWDQAGRPYEAARWRRRAAFQVTNLVPRRDGRER